MGSLRAETTTRLSYVRSWPRSNHKDAHTLDKPVRSKISSPDLYTERHNVYVKNIKAQVRVAERFQLSLQEIQNYNLWLRCVYTDLQLKKYLRRSLNLRVDPTTPSSIKCQQRPCMWTSLLFFENVDNKVRLSSFSSKRPI